MALLALPARVNKPPNTADSDTETTANSSPPPPGPSARRAALATDAEEMPTSAYTSHACRTVCSGGSRARSAISARTGAKSAAGAKRAPLPMAVFQMELAWKGSSQRSRHGRVDDAAAVRSPASANVLMPVV